MAESALVKAWIQVSGMVQGVGFRPFVARLAREYDLTGFVRNALGQVEIEAIGPPNALSRFAQDLSEKAPAASRIQHVEARYDSLPMGESVPLEFVIAASEAGAEGLVMPTPDLAVCPDCLREMDTPGDPRYQNPFISCTHCGPRFSILEGLPYDRPNTAMAAFPLCPLCAGEYQNPRSRRYHAQTVCCNACGPRLCYRAQAGEPKTKGNALSAAAGALKAGGIIAVKGIGGYHLACSPFYSQTVNQLRMLKGREQKPFAVMFESLASLKEHCFVSGKEEALLTSAPRPIVLLRRKPCTIVPEVYTASPDLGAFLPYTPLQHLLLRLTGPLIMTSANPSSLPILKDDEEMLSFLSSHSALAGVLSHDRAILRRLDDSVAAVIAGETILLRRARGYVPLPIPLNVEGPSLLACGGQEKSAICLCRGGYAYPSTEMGELSTLEAEKVYRETIRDMASLLRIAPVCIAHDLHPAYAATRFAKREGLPLLPVQHHHAHIGSVMAEHGLTEPIIGVAFDGTGYGTDGSIRGGEFLIAEPTGFTRAAHLKPVLMLGGDESIRQGWKSAACLLWDAGLSLSKDSRTALLEKAIASGVNCYPSSSMGRVFDGVSALLGICRESSYGGQCAMELEYAAAAYLAQGGERDVSPLPYALAEKGGILLIDLAPCLRTLQALHLEGEAANALAWRFHVTISEMILTVCQRLSAETGMRKVALSGGVFANRLLVERTVPLLRKAGLTVYRNHRVPPGDGGLALGQAYAALWKTKEQEESSCALQPPEG